MRPKELALLAVFAAISLVLEPIRIPVFFWPGQYFRLWEIPIVTAFLLFSPKIGIFTAILNAVSYIAVFPDAAGIIGPPWRIVLMISVFVGLYIAQHTMTKDKPITQPENRKKKYWNKPLVLLTSLSMLSRTFIMPLVDITVLNFLYPFILGRDIPFAAIIGLLPAIVIFNLIVPLYTVPIAYTLSKVISRNSRLSNLEIKR